MLIKQGIIDMKELKKAEFIYLTTLSVVFVLIILLSAVLMSYVGDWGLVFTVVCGVFYFNIVGFISSKIIGEEA
jgi:hypothetical protein